MIALRRSRLGLTALLPDQENWPARFYVEFDFMGNRNSRSVFGAEDFYFTEPSFRFRHYYFTVEHGGWQILAGQTWSLFGWQPTYRTATVSAPAGPGVLSQRHRQFTAIKSFKPEESLHWQLGLSFGSASEKAGGIPNVDLGVKLIQPQLRGLFSPANGQVRAEPLSLALSSTYRKFATGAINATSQNLHKMTAYAGALNMLIPLIPVRDGHAQSLTFTAEGSLGSGYGGSLSGWSGNLPQFPYSTESIETHLNKGYGGFDAQGKFHLFQLRTWSSQLQYHFAKTWITTVGYSQLQALNVRGLGPVPPGFTAYDHVSMGFANLMHDLSDQLRAAIEYSYLTTDYIDSTHQYVIRYQANLYYRF